VAELQGLGASLSDAERAGIEVVAVAPDENAQSQRLADGLHRGYRFVADPDLAVTRRYGLIHAGGGPGPVAIGVEADGGHGVVGVGLKNHEATASSADAAGRRSAAALFAR